MKSWKCPSCHKTKETKDKIIMVVCNCCRTQMINFPYQFEREVEVNGEGIERETN
jgi:ribosomal protein L37AE/L43A